MWAPRGEVYSRGVAPLPHPVRPPFVALLEQLAFAPESRGEVLDPLGRFGPGEAARSQEPGARSQHNSQGCLFTHWGSPGSGLEDEGRCLHWGQWGERWDRTRWEYLVTGWPRRGGLRTRHRAARGSQPGRADRLPGSRPGRGGPLPAACALLRRHDQARDGLILKLQLPPTCSRPPRSCVHSRHLPVPGEPACLAA